MTPVTATPATPHKERIRADAAPGKFFVPPANEWDTLLEQVQAFVTTRQTTPPLTFSELETEADALLLEQGLDAHYREFLIVLINNEIWRPVVAAIPFGRRTLLLPPCLRATQQCKAEFDEYGLLCEQCGGCCIGGLSEAAEALGYAVLVAEGTSIVSTLLEQGAIDAVIGVSCMPSLERTFPHMADKAVPGMAIPLLQEGCENTLVMEDWVRTFLNLSSEDASGDYRDLNALKESVETWFKPDTVTEVLGTGITETETISIDWLTKSGKRWRPFLTAAVYEALRSGDGRPQTADHRPQTADSQSAVDEQHPCPSVPISGSPTLHTPQSTLHTPLPSPVHNVAIAIECIHKASLIYDDIQDRDEKRYGESTVHEKHGVPVALTAALFLLGRGYRLIAECGASPEQTNAMLQLATRGHCDLCLGQGAELCWMEEPTPLTADEVIDIFRYKTAPSFEVVFGLGALLGDAEPAEHEVIKNFSLAIGIAYQIQDDLLDYQRGGDVDDVKKHRPSIVLAIAHDRAEGDQRRALANAWCNNSGLDSEATRQIVSQLGAETTARELLERHKSEALSALRPLKNRNLKILLHRIAGKLFG